MSIFLVLLYLVLGLPIAILIYWEWNNYTKIIRRLPGPPTLPFLGNCHQMGRTAHEILNNLFEWWVEYGKVNYRLMVGPIPNVIVTEIKDLEFVLTSNTMLKKSSVYNMLHPWLGTGLLTADGSLWRKHRKMITPSFHFSILQDFHEIMNKNSTTFMKILREKSANDKIIDMQANSSFLTLEVICETAMGIKINSMENPNSELVIAFKDMCENINLRAFNPFKRNKTLYKLAPDYRGYCRTLNILNNFTKQVVEQRVETIKKEQNQAANNDNEFRKRKYAFLDNLLTANIDGKPLTKQEVCDEVSTFIFEGFDTTTSAISFAVYMLSRHPDIQKRVYEEQKEIFGEDMQRAATFQEIGEMNYLDLAMKEMERLYPSVPMVGRHTEMDYNINGTLIPKGTSIFLFIMAMGYREDIFKDPYKCDPSRFDIVRDAEKLHPYGYIPFSAGPRNCIGQKFAILELKTVISKIVRTFEILPPLDELISKNGLVQHFFGLPKEEAKRLYTPSPYDPIFSAVLTLKSDNGILVRLRERQT